MGFKTYWWTYEILPSQFQRLKSQKKSLNSVRIQFLEISNSIEKVVIWIESLELKLKVSGARKKWQKMSIHSIIDGKKRKAGFYNIYKFMLI